MKMRKKNLEVVHASAMSNGVKFYAQRQRGYIAISTVDENGTVKVQWCNKREYIKEKSFAEKMYERDAVLHTLPDANSHFICKCIGVVYEKPQCRRWCLLFPSRVFNYIIVGIF